MSDEGAVLPDPHAASLLGREVEPPIRRPRPKFRHYPGPVVCSIVGALFGALTAFGYITAAATLSPGFYQFMAAMTAAMVFGAVSTTLIWLGFGVTMSLRELGVVFVTRGRQTSLRYDEIDAITLDDKARYDERRAVAALTRTITFESRGRKSRVHYVALPRDPLDPMLTHLFTRVAAEPRPREGKGWRLDGSTLHSRDQAVPLSMIAKAGVFDQEVRLWRRGDESPFLAVSAYSRNALLLLHLGQRAAESATPSQTVAQSVASDGTALGRLLFVRRTTVTSVITMTLLLYGALWIGLLSVDRLYPRFATLGHGALLALAVLITLRAINRLATRYRFYERGLTRTSLLGNRTLLYAAVQSVTWRETITTVNHISVGTTAAITLVSDDSKPLKIKLHRFRASDADLEPVRRAISQNIAHRLHVRLAAGEDLQWTSRATFTQAGVVVKTGLFGPGTELLPYDHPIGMLLKNGYLILYRETWRKPLATLNADSENFYAGLALFQSLMRAAYVAEENVG